MDAELWRKVEWTFQSALLVPPGEREEYVSNACRDAPDAKEHCLRLIRAHSAAGAFLEYPLFSDSASARSFGSWTVRERIAEGGMGVVYRVARSDGEYEAEAALKLVRASIESDEHRRRFCRERQLLARLNHPNIARLLDGGISSDGRPYLVMEYVAGLPLDKFAEQERLSLRRRLELFEQVCRAVQYLHQNLVVHGDLKPENIFVTPEALVKVLDFGNARMLADPAEPTGDTMPAMRFITPEYASPEQVRGEPLTPATDVYALGVLLYKLLSGRLPYSFSGTSPGAIERTICQSVPAPLRTVAPAIADRDLESILSQALTKERESRYPTALELADDVRRYLNREPVLARAGGLRYRTGKFLRRNARRVGMVALLAFTALSGLAAAWFHSSEASIQRERAESAVVEVRRFAATIRNSVGGAVAPASVTEVRAEVLRAAVEHLRRVADGLNDDPAVLLELSGAYRQLGVALGTASNFRDQMISLDKALSLAERAHASMPSPASEAAVARALVALADSHRTRGEDDVALPLYLRALPALRVATRREARDVEPYVTTLLNASQILSERADPEGLSFEDEIRQAATRAGSVWDFRAVLSVLHLRAASRALRAGDLRLKSLECAAALPLTDDPASAHGICAQPAVVSIELLQARVADYQRRVEYDSVNHYHKLGLWRSYELLGQARLNSRQPLLAATAFEHARQVIAGEVELHRSSRMERYLAVTLEELADAQALAGRRADAIGNYRLADSLRDRVVARQPGNLAHLQETCVLRLKIADLDPDYRARKSAAILSDLRRVAAAGLPGAAGTLENAESRLGVTVSFRRP